MDCNRNCCIVTFNLYRYTQQRSSIEEVLSIDDNWWDCGAQATFWYKSDLDSIRFFFAVPGLHGKSKRGSTFIMLLNQMIYETDSAVACDNCHGKYAISE